MTTRKPQPIPAAVKQALARASIPARPVIAHTTLFRAELQASLAATNNALLAADTALSSAADDCDMAVTLANQKYEAIRVGVDAERADLILKIGRRHRSGHLRHDARTVEPRQPDPGRRIAP